MTTNDMSPAMPPKGESVHRVRIRKLVASKTFEGIVFAAILVSCILMSLSDPTKVSKQVSQTVEDIAKAS